jgi:hypothetical protein
MVDPLHIWPTANGESAGNEHGRGQQRSRAQALMLPRVPWAVHLARTAAYAASAAARSITASNIALVKRPVNVFCWLG